MGRIIIYFCFLFLVAKTNAQCIVDAGKDTIVCLPDFNFSHDTLRLSADVTNATEPYQVSWCMQFETGSTSVPFLYASDFLDDTTSLNPQLYTNIVNQNNTPLVFKIEIMDDLGNTCKDSTTVRFSKFFITSIEYEIQLSTVDTTDIYATVAGGIPPITYSWFPKENIDTTTNESCCPLVWPEQNTEYIAYAIDSIGCTHIANPTWKFFIMPSSITNLNQENIKVYPNPTSEFLFFDFKDKNEAYSLVLYDLSGKIILKETIYNNSLNVAEVSSGVYLYYVYKKSELVAMGKVLKE